MKKFIISIIILTICAIAVFVLGWLEFYVPVDKVGVLVSKTGGVQQEVIRPGNFTWSWERLIPTNSKIITFSCAPKTYTREIQGSLPSSDAYQNMIDGNPNFSYHFSIGMDMNMKEDYLTQYVHNTKAENQEDLETYLNKQADSIARIAIQYILEESIDDIDFVILASISDTQLLSSIQSNGQFNNIDINAIHINDVTLPDITMYNHAKNSYNAYQEAIEITLEDSFELEGFDAALDYLELERLSRLGKVLAEYPQLIDYMAVSNGNTNFQIPETPSVSEITQ